MARNANASSLIQFRVGEDWLAHMDSTLREMDAFDGDPVDRSSFIRDTVGIELAFWKRSPYVCPRARHFVFVTQEREFWYHREETLRLNHLVARLPASLSMKMAKRDYFRSTRKTDEAIKGVWLLNHATLLRRTKPEPKPLDGKSDPDGVFQKHAVLECGLPAGSSVIRECCYGLADYAQTLDLRASSPEGNPRLPAADEEFYDHADIPIDIPTRDLEMIVVVDRRLFGDGGGSLGEDFDHSLAFELRNREEIGFSSTHAFESLLRDRFLERIGASFPPSSSRDAFYDDSVKEVREGFARFQQRARELSKDDKNLAPDAAHARRRVAELELPPEYLFYRLKWSFVHLGLHLSVKWVKPEQRA